MCFLATYALRYSMKKLTLFLTLCALFAFGCTGKKSDEYTAIKNSGLTGEALYEKLIAFDKNHPDTFESKLDLASYYFISGSRGDAWKYALKAEGLLASVKSGVPEKRALLFALLSALYAADEDADKARDYAKKAYEVPGSGAEYGYLYAKMQLLHGAENEALALFEKTYSLYPKRIAPEEMRSYMYLLADAGEFQKCADLLEPYFETGFFFPGLGVFASAVYEELGDTEKALLYAFLDYEYAADGKSSAHAFSANLKSVEALLPSGGTSEALESIKSLFDVQLEAKAPSSPFFVSDYIYSKAKLLRNDFSPADFSALLQIEKYFSQFPSYYWTVWEAVRALEPERLNDWLRVLEKTIALAPSSSYASLARESLASCIGLEKKNASALLIPQEVKAAVDGFAATADDGRLFPLYALLDLPDCSYVYAGVQIVKLSASEPLVHAALVKKFDRSSGRLKDRLAFILS